MPNGSAAPGRVAPRVDRRLEVVDLLEARSRGPARRLVVLVRRVRDQFSAGVMTSQTMSVGGVEGLPERRSCAPGGSIGRRPAARRAHRPRRHRPPSMRAGRGASATATRPRPLIVATRAGRRGRARRSGRRTPTRGRRAVCVARRPRHPFVVHGERARKGNDASRSSGRRGGRARRPSSSATRRPVCCQPSIGRRRRTPSRRRTGRRSRNDPVGCSVHPALSSSRVGGRIRVRRDDLVETTSSVLREAQVDAAVTRVEPAAGDRLLAREEVEALHP